MGPLIFVCYNDEIVIKLFMQLTNHLRPNNFTNFVHFSGKFVIAEFDCNLYFRIPPKLKIFDFFSKLFKRPKHIHFAPDFKFDFNPSSQFSHPSLCSGSRGLKKRAKEIEIEFHTKIFQRWCYQSKIISLKRKKLLTDFFEMQVELV